MTACIVSETRSYGATENPIRGGTFAEKPGLMAIWGECLWHYCALCLGSPSSTKFCTFAHLISSTYSHEHNKATFVLRIKKENSL